MKVFLILLLLVFLTFLEVFSLPIPFVLFALILLAIFIQKPWIYFAAVVLGFLLDSLLFQQLGLRSLFFLCVIGAIFLYARKFEIQNSMFIGMMTIISSLGYFLLFGYTNLLAQLLMSAMLPLFSLVGMHLLGRARARMV